MKNPLLLLSSVVVLSCNSNKPANNEKKDITTAGSFFAQSGKLTDEILSKGKEVFTQNCILCHNDTNKVGAPNIGVLGSMTPRAILSALRNGRMKLNAEKLSQTECEVVAQWLANKPLIQSTIPQSAYTKFELPATSEIRGWISGWGNNLASTGFTSTEDAGITPSNVQTLQLKWSFAFPDASQARCKPAVIGDWIVVGSQLGDVFAIHKKSGLIGWHFIADAAIRGGIQFDRSGDSLKVFFADYSTNVYALNLRNGKLIWKKRAGMESQSGVSGSVTVYDNMVYIPLTSYEVASATKPDYHCCVTSGGVVALNAVNGDFAWWHRVIADSATLSGKKKGGKPVYGPSGAPVWCSPTVDVKRGQLLIGTGENYTIPATTTSDAVQALDLKTGRLLWNYQATPHDTWNLACPGGENCPDKIGPDLDFGMAPMLIAGSSGKDILVIGQKSGVVHALEPETGKLIWKTRIGKGGALGGIHMGMATDGRYAYAPNADNIYALDKSDSTMKATPGLYALDLRTGKVAWRTEIPPCDTSRKGCLVSNSAAPLSLPGLVFAGGLDGQIRAYQASTGKIVWTFDAVRDFQTVNGVTGRGGAMDGPSPVASDGMLYVNAGYDMFGEVAGNVLLAFEVKKR